MPDVQHENYTRLNDVEIEKILLRTDSGAEIEISEMVNHVSIFEDISSPYLTGYAYISDAINLRGHLPVSGHESFIINFRTPGIGTEMRELDLDVYAMTDRTKARNDRNEMYKINFSSKMQRWNEQQRINKAYSGCISCIVNDIIKDYFPEGTNCWVEKTKGEFKFVIPNLKPLDAIKWLSKKAISAKSPHSTNFVFYEGLDGFVFASMGIMSLGNTSRHYTMRPAGMLQPNLLEQMNNIQDFEIHREYNRQEDLANGLYSSTLWTHDITTKKIEKKTLTYGDECSGGNFGRKLEEGNILPPNSKWAKTNANGPTFFRPKQQYAYSSASMNEDGSITYFYDRPHDELNWDNNNLGNNYIDNFNPEDYLLQNRSSTGIFGNIMINIRVAGDSSLSVGQIVDVKIPSNEPLDSIDEDWFDKYYSGKYLITCIRHVITNTSGGEYTSVLELSRNSLPKIIPTSKTIDGVGNIDYTKLERLEEVPIVEGDVLQ